mmetsp:Transcript_10131/g.16596  ORF Transcript_10131/g.16596 Transcript_10131/m.16596 type:complete len:289 (-) Transcript_10131:73-939(-)
MKKALAQLYSSCSRNQSFGEMLLAKIENQTDPSPSVDHVNDNVKNGNQQHGTKGDKVVNDTSIDWKMVFDYFDHRRLITFGLVRGLIRRVHQYPLAYAVLNDTDEVNTGREPSSNGAIDDEDDELDYFSNVELSPGQYHMPIEVSKVAEAAAAAAGKAAMDDRSWSTSYSTSPNPRGFLPPPLNSRDTKAAMDERSWSTSYSASPLPGQSFLPPPLNSRDDILLNKLTQKEMHLREGKLLLERIASAMDGTRCDDELSCMFEIPIEKLIEMLKGTGRWNIISVFSCTN